jgi:uncharacterized membrane protein YphA (DoxX/SURF4 family)
MSTHTLGVAAAVVVAGVLLVSGIAKLASPREWRTQSAGLGVSRPIAEIVPYVELVIGALLLVQWQRHLVAWFAVGLLCAFTVLIAVRLAQGQRPPCACFGSWSSRPIGVGHLVRNVVFIAVGVLAAVL